MQEGNLLGTLRQFAESRAEFIVVGGVAAVLNGAPIQTYDIDVVYSRNDDLRLTGEVIERLARRAQRLSGVLVAHAKVQGEVL